MSSRPIQIGHRKVPVMVRLSRVAQQPKKVQNLLMSVLQGQVHDHQHIPRQLGDNAAKGNKGRGGGAAEAGAGK
jgi:hypothetical protein